MKIAPTKREFEMNYCECSKCGGDLHIGIAIKPNRREDVIYEFYRPTINNETLELIPVFKCIECGHSFDDREFY